MSVTKYAFIINSKTLTPKSYSGTIESDYFKASFCAVNSQIMAQDTAKKLSDQGVSFIDLCGDFDEEAAKEIQKIVGEQTTISFMKYLPEELNKIEALESLRQYGIIIIDESFNRSNNRLVIKSNEFNTYIAAVGSLDEAFEAAQQLVEDGIYFIELCSGFNCEMAKAVISSINGEIPIGFAGEM